MRTLRTNRLELRAARPDEFDRIYEILVQEIEGPDFERSAFDAEMTFDQSISKQPIGEWFGRPAVTLRDVGRYVGYCVLMPRLCSESEVALLTTQTDQDPGVSFSRVEVEIGWAISERFRRRGLATEAARALLAHAWEFLNIDRVVAFTDRQNHASLGVMQRIGMQLHNTTTEVMGVVRRP